MNLSLSGISRVAKVMPIIFVLATVRTVLADPPTAPPTRLFTAPLSDQSADYDARAGDAGSANGDVSEDVGGEAVGDAIGEAIVGNPIAARYKVSMCVGCHGIADYRTAFPQVYHVPRIGGQNAAYIRAALEDYRNGKRRYATMHAIAVTLSDQDIADIAAYYAAQNASSLDNPLK